MGISIGLVGLGQFGSAFADLFKSHPLVDRIGLCDVEPDRIAKFANDPFFKDKFSPKDAYASLDDICRADFDALVIITQHWMHAPQCLQAMKSGKHVYSAVPIISIPDVEETLEWCGKLTDASRTTGQYYMLGETTYYRPLAMFCRRMAKEGRFGDFVYAEGEYFHDVDSACNLREVLRRRTSSTSGRELDGIMREYMNRGMKGGPMNYPTHSTCGPVCVMNAHAVSVSCHGYANKTGDPFFANDAFSNQIAMFEMSNGALVRIAEMRETPGCFGKDDETFRIAGTLGSYSEDRWFEIKRPDFRDVDMGKLPKPVEKALTDEEMRDPLPQEVQEAFKHAVNKNLDEKDLQNLDFKPSGHGGSHPYLVHEFVDAVANNRQPAINIWEASKYMAMGAVAHKSAMAGGEKMHVPNWGNAPR